MPQPESTRVWDESLSPMEIRRAGMKALIRELGAAGFIRFMQQSEPGRGDYTAERHAWLDGLTLESIVDDIRRSRPRPEPDLADPLGMPGAAEA